MNRYRVIYRRGSRDGPQLITADTVNGFQPTHDTYVFRIGDEVEVAIPKAGVVSIQRIPRAGSDDGPRDG